MQALERRSKTMRHLEADRGDSDDDEDEEAERE
jgi:hypothetical protein